jgi:hypothetical protein
VDLFTCSLVNLWVFVVFFVNVFVVLQAISYPSAFLFFFQEMLALLPFLAFALNFFTLSFLASSTAFLYFSGNSSVWTLVLAVRLPHN